MNRSTSPRSSMYPANRRYMRRYSSNQISSTTDFTQNEEEGPSAQGSRTSRAVSPLGSPDSTAVLGESFNRAGNISSRNRTAASLSIDDSRSNDGCVVSSSTNLIDDNDSEDDSRLHERIRGENVADRFGRRLFRVFLDRGSNPRHSDDRRSVNSPEAVGNVLQQNEANERRSGPGPTAPAASNVASALFQPPAVEQSESNNPPEQVVAPVSEPAENVVEHPLSTHQSEQDPPPPRLFVAQDSTAEFYPTREQQPCTSNSVFFNQSNHSNLSLSSTSTRDEPVTDACMVLSSGGSNRTGIETERSHVQQTAGSSGEAVLRNRMKKASSFEKFSLIAQGLPSTESCHTPQGNNSQEGGSKLPELGNSRANDINLIATYNAVEENPLSNNQNASALSLQLQCTENVAQGPTPSTSRGFWDTIAEKISVNHLLNNSNSTDASYIRIPSKKLAARLASMLENQKLLQGGISLSNGDGQNQITLNGSSDRLEVTEYDRLLMNLESLKQSSADANLNNMSKNNEGNVMSNEMLLFQPESIIPNDRPLNLAETPPKAPSKQITGAIKKTVPLPPKQKLLHRMQSGDIVFQEENPVEPIHDSVTSASQMTHSNVTTNSSSIVDTFTSVSSDLDLHDVMTNNLRAIRDRLDGVALAGNSREDLTSDGVGPCIPVCYDYNLPPSGHLELEDTEISTESSSLLLSTGYPPQIGLENLRDIAPTNQLIYDPHGALDASIAPYYSNILGEDMSRAYGHDLNNLDFVLDMNDTEGMRTQSDLESSIELHSARGEGSSFRASIPPERLRNGDYVDCGSSNTQQEFLHQGQFWNTNGNGDIEHSSPADGDLGGLAAQRSSRSWLMDHRRMPSDEQGQGGHGNQSLDAVEDSHVVNMSIIDNNAMGFVRNQMNRTLYSSHSQSSPPAELELLNSLPGDPHSGVNSLGYHNHAYSMNSMLDGPSQSFEQVEASTEEDYQNRMENGHVFSFNVPVKDLMKERNKENETLGNLSFSTECTEKSKEIGRSEESQSWNERIIHVVKGGRDSYESSLTTVIQDNPVLPKSYASLPVVLEFDKVDGEGSSQYRITIVKVCEKISSNTRFGPVEGPIKKLTKESLNQPDTEYPLLIFKMVDDSNTLWEFDRTDDHLCNWMKFVRKGTNMLEINTLLSEQNGHLYFTTIKELVPGDELRVGYSAEYFNRFQRLSQEDLEPSQDGRNNPEIEEGIEAGRKESEKIRECGLIAAENARNIKKASRFPCFECDDVAFDCLDDLNSHLENLHDVIYTSKFSKKKRAAKLFQEKEKLLNKNSMNTNTQPSDPPSASVVVDSPKATVPTKPFESQSEHKLNNSQAPAGSPDSYSSLKVRLECAVCSKSFSSKNRLQRHVISHGDEESKPYKCDGCPKRFLSSWALSCHSKIHSDGGKMFECPMCHYKTQQVLQLRDHVQKHKDKESGLFQCPQCNKKFAVYSIIRKHIKTFHGPRQFGCEHCSKKFATQERLRIHNLIHSSRKEFLCQKCGRLFKRKDKLREHIKRVHDAYDDKKGNNGSRSQKRISKAAERKALRRQMMNNYVFKCEDCGIGFKRRGMLVNHMVKKHPSKDSKSIPELCLPICRADKNYYCLYCERVYKSTSKRKMHILKAHPGKPLPCLKRDRTTNVDNGGVVPSKDDKIGFTIQNAAKMIKTVTDDLDGSKSYASFNNPSVETVVGKVVKEPDKCQWCPKEYATRAKLLQHQRKFHLHLMPPEIQLPRAQRNNSSKYRTISSAEVSSSSVEMKAGSMNVGQDGSAISTPQASRTKRDGQRFPVKECTSNNESPFPENGQLIPESISVNPQVPAASEHSSVVQNDQISDQVNLLSSIISRNHRDNNVIGFLITTKEPLPSAVSGNDLIMVPLQNGNGNELLNLNFAYPQPQSTSRPSNLQ